jgi:hypothetical protein
MDDNQKPDRRHESIDHVHPTDAGLMDPDPTHQPATGVMGDETLVRMTGGGIPPYPGTEGHNEHPAHHPRPGPTVWNDEPQAQRPATDPAK